jgi:DNA-binding transcriptional LysR family regulator
LEESLGVRLLQRTTRRVSLTEAGEIYYQKARQIQHDVVEANLSISGFKETPSGVLRISAPHTWTETLIAPHLGDFLRQYPDIMLDIECNDQFQDMIEDRLDLVVRVGVLKDSSFIAVPFGQIRMVLCATPAYLEENGAPQECDDLLKHQFVMFEDFNQLLVTHDSHIQTISITGNIKVNTVPLMLAAVQQNLGFTVLPDLLVKPFIQSGELVEIFPQSHIEIKHLPINCIFALYSSRKHLSAKARVFLDFFKSRIDQ